ncbi:ABC transporter ATP-binding protein [Salinimicrobium sp. GXAS 041]|uniref:ABC transporter ATP-binding protein n=1 Tax=Salinimicrobium sp. GXAS 041 TaxID=3400806 RepID=UPI003C77C962
MNSEEKNTILKTENLSTGYLHKREKKVISSEVNVELFEGELVAVIGINGVGKSTFLRTLSGVQPALGGKIFLQEKDREQIDPPQLASLISLVLTEQPVSRNLRVEELVALGRQPYTNWIGTVKAEDKKHIQQALERVNIFELRKKKCYELSDGQFQKVLIARALAQNTPLVILDEPTSHLDMYHKAQVLQLLKKLSRETGKAILFATHEINLAIQLCDKIILMQQDKITHDSPEELVSKRAFENVFPKDLIIFDRDSESFKIKT